ncbi:MAG: DUF2489 domain-containing protein [Pseudomonadota bacterium]|nr:DUF2489 domain-containing protein [Pseudomonadota bacterium]
MSSTTVYGLLAVGIIIIVGLVAVAIYYLKKVKEMEKNQAEAIALLEEKIEPQRQNRIKSIRIIAQGILDEQLTLTEGAIRLSALLSAMEQGESHREEYKAFFLLAEATNHIPVLDEWKELSTKKKLSFDRERTGIEKDHKEFVIDASKRLVADGRFQVEATLFYQAK